ncbi:MAG: hypothetical protein GYB20_07720 [Oceanospirillales bacterium]|nr:hypothetical protein [Oceanospirillales bacterium]MBR9887569.1 hypothetical protein [Oceanospirillales bacterium]
MKEILPLLVALFGAGFGAYFAILKSKSEKLWFEKYEALKNIVDTAESISHESNIRALEVLGVSTISEEEAVIFEKEILESKNQIRKSISRIKLLFKKKDIEEILEAYQDFYGAIIRLKNMRSHEYRVDYHDDLECKAIDLVNATVLLAQKKCT